MNTKVNKLQELYNMRSHKALRIVNLLDNYLPKRSYTAEIIKRGNEKEIEVSQQIVRDVKSFRTKNPRVLEIIVEFAIENENAQKNMEDSVKAK